MEAAPTQGKHTARATAWTAAVCGVRRRKLLLAKVVDEGCRARRLRAGRTHRHRSAAGVASRIRAAFATTTAHAATSTAVCAKQPLTPTPTSTLQPSGGAVSHGSHSTIPHGRRRRCLCWQRERNQGPPLVYRHPANTAKGIASKGR